MHWIHPLSQLPLWIRSGVGLPVSGLAVADATLSTGLDAVIEQYAGYGPLLAAFLANLLATVGDKGQLVVVALASRYDAKRVFLGAMAAFTAWSAVEVAFAQALVGALPGGALALATGVLFLLFGASTLRGAVASFTRSKTDSEAGILLTGGGLDVGLAGRLLPDAAVDRAGAYGGLLTSFVFVAFAEVGDKTQLLTINLAATFPDAPLAVFVGVVAALALRTGVDALLGERIERRVPTRWLELVASYVFLAFGVAVVGSELGVVPPAISIPGVGAVATLFVLLTPAVAAIFGLVASGLYRAPSSTEGDF
jgi:putative Ca2+/H+ antiporter (TMEM165/GDT1 family)